MSVLSVYKWNTFFLQVGNTATMSFVGQVNFFFFCTVFLLVRAANVKAPKQQVVLQAPHQGGDGPCDWRTRELTVLFIH